jgi:Fe-S-cluster-containing hydrogenase component 2
LCAKVCPTQAATGERKAVHKIDDALCIKCGLCYEACRFKAIEVATGMAAAEVSAPEVEA